ncbi:MAG: membrane protein insertase YidC [Treponema sp.]|nr:membrane protein insertase YidC [Treponema sp.]
MDKNTVLALVLSALVLVVSIFVETNFIIPRQRAKMELQAAEQMVAEQQKQEERDKVQISAASILKYSENETSESENSAETVIPEQTYTISTEKVKVVFTNKGGDIISYQLLDHLDKETGVGVEMVDNVTQTNRAFSLAFGDTGASAINDTFNVKIIDDYTIGFSRIFERVNDLGVTEKFVLGKLYTFKPDDYVFRLDITISTGENGNGLNIGGASYTLRTAPQIGPHYDPKKNRYEVRQYVALNGNSRTKKGFSNRYYNKPYDWAGVAGKYFTMLVKPAAPMFMSPMVKCSLESGTAYQNAQVFLTRNAIEANSVTDTYYIYVGPRSESELIKYNSNEKNAWGLVNAKFNQALQTSGFLSLVEVAFKWSLEQIYKVVHNWGVAIIILTIILKIILFPLNKKSAMGTLKMQALQPQIQEIQTKYKDNPQKMQEETAKLYKKVGFNPASGCLPMVLQMIVLFAMYNVFNNHFEFRGAGFIHGWIDDLSVGDGIWTWNRNIPFISSFTQNTLRLLPFIYTISQLLNGKITQYGGANLGGSQQSQMMFMMYGMPLLFFFMFYNVPSGLLLYWTVSNILQIGQQLIINKIIAGKKAEIVMPQKSTRNAKKHRKAR